MSKKMVTSCSFRRTENSNTERGIAIGTDVGDIDIIIDKEMKPVDGPIWTYRLLPYEGTILLEV